MASEQSFIMIKPDGVQRGLISDIIARFEKRGYKLVGLKLTKVSKEHAERHYADLADKPFFGKLCDFLSSSPVVAMVWEGEDIVVQGRKMIGATKPGESAPGTIRGDYALVVGKNIIHGSDSVESAKKEIALWFTADEVCSYTPCATDWIYE